MIIKKIKLYLYLRNFFSRKKLSNKLINYNICLTLLEHKWQFYFIMIDKD